VAKLIQKFRSIDNHQQHYLHTKTYWTGNLVSNITDTLSSYLDYFRRQVNLLLLRIGGPYVFDF
jgi:hypothetical protein